MDITRDSELIDTAADLIVQQGWTRGREGWPDHPEHIGALCAEGALMKAAGLSWDSPSQELIDFWQSPAVTAVADQVGHRFIPVWNDGTGRTQSEVVREFRNTAAALRRREELAS